MSCTDLCRIVHTPHRTVHPALLHTAQYTPRPYRALAQYTRPHTEKYRCTAPLQPAWSMLPASNVGGRSEVGGGGPQLRPPVRVEISKLSKFYNMKAHTKYCTTSRVVCSFHPCEMQVLLGTRQAHLGQPLPQLKFSRVCKTAAKQGKKGRTSSKRQQRQLTPHNNNGTALIRQGSGYVREADAGAGEGGKICAAGFSTQDLDRQRQQLVDAVEGLVGAGCVWGFLWEGGSPTKKGAGIGTMVPWLKLGGRGVWGDPSRKSRVGPSTTYSFTWAWVTLAPPSSGFHLPGAPLNGTPSLSV